MINITLLIVEDEKELLDSLYCSLKFLYKNVLTASNGLDAIEIMKSFDVDVVVTDIHMPYVSGIEVIRYAILHNTPIIPAVVMSGYDDILKEWKNLKYIEVINKPINIKVLNENIKTVLKYSENDYSEQYCASVLDVCDNTQLLLDKLVGNYN